MLYVGLFIGLAVGISFGIAIASQKPFSIGTLHIVSSDEGSPLLFVELSESMEDVAKRTSATVRIRARNYITQK